MAEPLGNDEPNNYEEIKLTFLNSLCVDVYQRNTIEEETRSQSNSRIWHTERRKRLIASNCGRICIKRPPHHVKILNMI